MSKIRNLKLFLVAVFACFLYTHAQTEESSVLTKQVLSVKDEYPTFKMENVTKKEGEDCICQANFSFANYNWNSWSNCQGGSGSRLLGCHHGVRFRNRRCSSERGSNYCVNRMWQYCYHEETCQGQWVEYADESKSCDPTKKESVRIRICEQENRIGLFCASKQRAPYDVTVIPCAEETFQPNNTTWIAAGAGLLLGMFIVGLLVCINKCRDHKEQGKSSKNSPTKSNKTLITRHNEAKKSISESRNSNATLLRDDVTRDTRYYNSTALHSSTSTATLKANIERFPDPPPVLRHSFSENHPVASEQAVYSIPSPKSVPIDGWDIQTGNVSADAYMESSTRFCDEKQSSTKDHVVPVSYSADNYMDTSSRTESHNFYPSVSRQGSGSGSKAYGIPPLGDYASPTTLPTPSKVKARDSHVYAEIPQKSMQTFR